MTFAFDDAIDAGALSTHSAWRASDSDYGIGLDLRWLSGDVRAGFHARDGDGPQWAVNPLLDRLLFGDTEGLRAGDDRIQAQHRALWGDETESRHRRPPA